MAEEPQNNNAYWAANQGNRMNNNDVDKCCRG